MPGAAVQEILAVCGGLWAQPGEGTSGGAGATEHHGRALALGAVGTLGLVTQACCHIHHSSVCELWTLELPGDISVALHNGSPQLQGVCSSCCSH